MSQNTLNINVKVNIPPGSTTNPTPQDLTFTVDSDTIELLPGDPSHDLVWQLWGTYNDGETTYPEECLLLTTDPPGIKWYSADDEKARNPHLNAGQLRQLQSWIQDPNHAPTLGPHRHSASVTIDRGDMTGILVRGETLKLYFDIHVQVCAVDDEEHPWVVVDNDPEVDIEMHA